LTRTFAHSSASIVWKCELGPRPGVPKKRQVARPRPEAADALGVDEVAPVRMREKRIEARDQPQRPHRLHRDEAVELQDGPDHVTELVHLDVGKTPIAMERGGNDVAVAREKRDQCEVAAAERAAREPVRNEQQRPACLPGGKDRELPAALHPRHDAAIGQQEVGHDSGRAVRTWHAFPAVSRYLAGCQATVILGHARAADRERTEHRQRRHHGERICRPRPRGAGEAKRQRSGWPLDSLPHGAHRPSFRGSLFQPPSSSRAPAPTAPGTRRSRGAHPAIAHPPGRHDRTLTKRNARRFRVPSGNAWTL
jgi:hypothetical protein